MPARLAAPESPKTASTLTRNIECNPILIFHSSPTTPLDEILTDAAPKTHRAIDPHSTWGVRRKLLVTLNFVKLTLVDTSSPSTQCYQHTGMKTASPELTTISSGFAFFSIML
jgi:hypothetical protein